MRILAVTCYTGPEKLVKMTESCVQGLVDSPTDQHEVDLCVSAYGQGAERMAFGASVSTNQEENKGFAHGMNAAIDMGLRAMIAGPPDYVLCFNNDLRFPRLYWLAKLLDAAVPNRVCVPATNRAAIRIQKGPINGVPIDVPEMSAYCWLVPFKWCQWLKEHMGWWLFDPAFYAYGEDNWTAFMLSKQYGRNVFRYVRRSFVDHCHGRTSKHVKPDRRLSNRLLVDRLTAQLKYPKLRGDLREWAQRYIAILKPGC
ncbi:MAG TPA: hypothetical protein VFH61_01795 [Thermoleophilia bacterium]|nr:hypothetical protein [Thermoleophilia bacterium]